MLKTPDAFQPLLRDPGLPAPASIVLQGGKVLLGALDQAQPGPETVLRLAGNAVPLPLGLWQGRAWQALALQQETAAPEGFAWYGLRALFGVVDEQWLGLCSRALQLAEWQRSHRYCGVCATPTQRLDGERAFKCPACGFTAYPRISPAMMVLIRKGSAVLLARHAQSPYQRFTALAGFLEAGESVEEAVHREVYEEVGLRVHNLRYFGSQSWPFPHSLMIAFTADYLDGEIRVDETEIAEARWFGPGDDFPEVPPGVSIATALINAHRPAEP